MNVKTSDGFISLRQASILIYGNPKIGKTTLLSGFPNMLILATESGQKSLKVDYVDITSWKQFKDEIVPELLKSKKLKDKYSSLGIDTIDILANLCIEYVCDEADIDHISEEKYGKSYDRLKKEFEREINKLFMSSYGLVFTSHTKIQELSSFGGSTSKIIPTLNNQCRSILIPKLDIIGCIQIKTIKDDEGKYKDIRVITFSPSAFLEAGDRTGRMPRELRVYKDASKTYKQMKEAYMKNGVKEGGTID
jgi:hypothetical protein